MNTQKMFEKLVCILTITAVFAICGFFIFSGTASATTAGPNAPGTMANDASVGTTDWNTPNNAKVEDGVLTSVSSVFTSHYLKATNFGFSIPTGATISGILCEIKRYHSGSGYSRDNSVKIVKSDGTLGTTDKADLVNNWPTSNTWIAYGSSSDLWGETWAPADINNANFGFVLSAKPGACVASSSQILTPTGYKSVKDVKVGDQVMSFNVEKNKIEKDVISDIIPAEKKAREMFKIYAQGLAESVETTGDHVFYTSGNKLKQASELKVGDVLLGDNNKQKKITKIEKTVTDDIVFDFVIENNHNFFINGVLVHNVPGSHYVDAMRITIYYTLNTAPSITAGLSDGSSSSTTPNNAGSNVAFTATATDPESNNYYLAICKTNSITANNNAPPTCGGSNWCISGSTASGSQASCNYATSAGDSESNVWYAFVCDYNASSLCSLSSQGSGDPGSPFSVNHAPSFSAMNNTSGYIKVGNNVSFTTTASDSDIDGSADTVVLYVCKSNDFTGTACGAAGEWCHSSASASNPTCNYTVQSSDSDGSHNYYGYIIDNHNFASTSNPRSSTFNTDKTAPTITVTNPPVNGVSYNSAGWTSLAPTFSCVDSGSGCDTTSCKYSYTTSTYGSMTSISCTGAIPAPSEGTNLTLHVAAKDIAGNTGTNSYTGFTYDTTAPNAATSTGWAEISPHNSTSVNANWTKSNSADLADQKIQFYSDATCTIISGSLIDLASNSVQTRAFTGVDGTTYTYKITSIDNATNQTVSACSSSMLIDTTTPTAPGNLTDGGKTTTSITLNFGAPSTETNFATYKIFYKAGASGVAESDSQQSDPNLGFINYNSATSTTVGSLLPNTQYVFNIWAYDTAGNKANATEIAITTPAVSHTVTFNSNGGSGSMSSQTTNVPTALTLNAFTRTGYTFANWDTVALGGGTTYADGATYGFASDVTLYAQWTPVPSHTVTFNSNGGSGSMSSQTTNVPTALTLNAFTRTGYTFANWDTVALGGGTTYADGATYGFASDVTLYAQWTANSGGGGGGGGGAGLPLYVIVASAGANGSISPAGSAFVAYGTSQTYNITPASGYQVASVLVDGTSVGAITAYTFSSVAIDHTISVAFSPVAAPAPACKFSDINCDGPINEYDFAVMMSQWGQTGTGLSGDLNHDGAVDELDFSLLMVNWGL